MSRPPPHPPANPGDEPRQLYLPNFCSASSVLGIVLICEITALLLALARNEAELQAILSLPEGAARTRVNTLDAFEELGRGLDWVG